MSGERYDLEDRTLVFAKGIIDLCRKLPNNTINFKLIDQIIRSSASVGANYREANDYLGKKDFLYRLRISRKEAKETQFWLDLILHGNSRFKKEVMVLQGECLQLRKIISSIINKFGKKLN